MNNETEYEENSSIVLASEDWALLKQSEIDELQQENERLAMELSVANRDREKLETQLKFVQNQVSSHLIVNNLLHSQLSELKAKLVMVGESTRKAVEEYIQIREETRYYAAKCEECGYVGISSEWTEDWNWEHTDCDVICPKCGQTSCDEVGLDEWVEFRIGEALQATSPDIQRFKEELLPSEASKKEGYQFYP